MILGCFVLAFKRFEFFFPCLFYFYNLGNPDTPEEIRLAPKYTSAEDILKDRLFYTILIDGGQRDSKTNDNIIKDSQNETLQEDICDIT